MSGYDTNGDGYVDAAELAAEWGWDEEKAQDHIDVFDDNEDGVIDSSEFAHVMTTIEGHLHE